MTNPPANWGYARTVEGFYHMIGRGQFERLNPMNPLIEPAHYLEASWRYCRETMQAMGWLYLLPCFLPLFFVSKIRGRGRAWIFGLAACFLSLSLLVLVMVNPPPDKQAWSMIMLYFPASHLVLTIWAGYGLVGLGTIAGQWRLFTRSLASA